MKTVREVIRNQLWRWLIEGAYPPGKTKQMLDDKTDSILSALKEAGYVCVPVEPDDAMIEAGKSVLDEWDADTDTEWFETDTRLMSVNESLACRIFARMFTASQDQGMG